MDKNEFPENREWNAKMFSMPKIPRGDEGQLIVLKDILNAVENDIPSQTALKFKGSNSTATLDRLCVWLRPIGLVYKEDGKWRNSSEAKKWMDTRDNRYLTAVLCTTIKFFGEILYFLEEPRKMSELQKIAVDQYHIN